MSRIYTSLITIGSVNIYTVSADPNGTLSAPIGSLAIQDNSAVTYQNSDGATTWVVIGTGGSVSSVAQQTLGPTLAIGEEQILQANGSTTLTFVATEECTLRKLVFEPTVLEVGTTAAQIVENPAQNMSIDRLEVVSGTGPDVGRTLLEGGGVVGIFFAAQNIANSPDLGIRLDAGDVVEIDVSERSNNQVLFDVAFTWTPTYSATLPKRILGSAAGPPFFAANIAGSNSSLGNLTVLAAPATAIITLTPVGQSPLNLTPAGGPRSSGANDYDNTIGTVTGLRDEIFAAFTDPANQFTSLYNFISGGVGVPDQIAIERLLPGAATNYDRVTTNQLAEFSTTIPSGGTSDEVTVAAVSPADNVTITDVYMARFTGGLVPSNTYTPFATLSGLDVAGSPQALSVANTPADTSRSLRQSVDIPVTAGQTIDVRARYGGPGTYVGAFMLVADQ